MSGFLVLAVCAGEDRPVALVEDRDAAARQAEALRSGAKEPARASSGGLSYYDFGRVIEFRDGKPVGVVTHSAGKG